MWAATFTPSYCCNMRKVICIIKKIWIASYHSFRIQLKLFFMMHLHIFLEIKLNSMSFEGQKVLTSLHYQIKMELFLQKRGNFILAKIKNDINVFWRATNFLRWYLYNKNKIDIYSKEKMKMHHHYNEKWRKLWRKYCVLMKYDVEIKL